MDKVLADVVPLVVKGLAEGALEGTGQEIAQYLRRRHPDETALAALAEAGELTASDRGELEAGLLRVGAGDEQLQRLLQQVCTRSSAGRDGTNTTVVGRLTAKAYSLFRSSASINITGRDTEGTDPKR